MRLNLIVLPCVLLLCAVLIGRVFYISMFEEYNGKSYALLAQEQQLRSVPIAAKRGTIYDRNMVVLAQSASAWKVILSPAQIPEEDHELIASGLSGILDVDREEILSMLDNKQSYYQVIKRRIEKSVHDEVVTFIEENDLSGIQLMEDSKRYYPYGNFLSTVLGFTGTDNQGLYGLELYYDDILKGQEGRVVASKDARGSYMPYQFESQYDPVPGNSLVLTVDEKIQHFLEKALEDTVETHQVKNRACGIVMDVNTGAILAMSTKPDYDLNDPYTITDPEVAAALETLEGDEQKQARLNALEQQRKNKALTELYEPGSVFKVVTGSAALEEGVMTLDHSFYCSGVIDVAGTKIHCWKRSGHGTLDFVDAVVNSCNPAFIETGQLLGKEKFYQYFKAYGFTEKTGIDLPGEASRTLYYTAEEMGPVELASESFGQSMNITPLQMITAFCATVNGGYLVQPHIVAQILDSEGNLVESINPEPKRQVISAETSEKMRMILEEAVSANGGNNAYIKGYRIGGKSGTAEKLGGDETDRVSSFVGFAPADDPQIAVLIMVDTPTAGEVYGSVVAAPAVASVMRDVLPYLGIDPKYSEDELENLDVVVPNLENSDVMSVQNKLSNMDLELRQIGDGTKVIKQIPQAGISVPKGSTIVIYTEEDYELEMTTVPLVMGLTPEQANRELTNAGLNIQLNGGASAHEDAKIVGQSIKQGEQVPKGTVVAVECLTVEAIN